VSTTLGAAGHIADATVRVDAGAARGPVRRIWTSFGYDIFNSGIGWSLPHWGAGNIYHDYAAGQPFYDFSIADQVYDAVVHAGHRPLVELAFEPSPTQARPRRPSRSIRAGARRHPGASGARAARARPEPDRP
jgi:hypothetical protein